MANPTHPVVIVGAGLAGLRCAQVLQQRGIQTLILEKESEVGGRMRTRQKQDFLLDEGFQVLLDSYEEVHQAVALPHLGLKSFQSGAVIAKGKGKFGYAFNPFRHPERLFSTLFHFPGTWSDVLRMGILAWKNRKADPDFWKRANTGTAADFLAEQSFSPRFINEFLRPFFGGVFLDPLLHLPKAYFLWLLAKFYTGKACLPEKGMGQLPKEMAKSAGEIRFQSGVTAIRSGELELENKEIIQAEWVVDARPFQEKEEKGSFRSTITVYLEGPAQPDLPRSLILNANPFSPLLHFCFPSAIQPAYAPEGKCLCSITLTQPPPTETLMKWLLPELSQIFPRLNWSDFSLLEVVSIPYALPGFPVHNDQSFRVQGQKLVIGDHCLYPSINGALRSGREAGEWLADRILAN